jgi:ABC-2 type transport system permease protein
VDADVLLIDEVLAVSDAAFQDKCFEEFARMKERGRTILFVTHDMDVMERFCDRALLLERGEVVDVGEPVAIAEQYRTINRDDSARRTLGEGQRRPARGFWDERRAKARPKASRYAPSALGGELRQFLRLTRVLATMDFKQHHLGSMLGAVFSVTRPVLMFVVLFLVFDRVAKFGDGVEHYPLYLLMAIMLWTFFSEATAGGLVCLARGEALLRKLRFPRMALPLSAVGKALLNLAVNLVPVIVLAAALGVEARLSWLELPVLVALLVILATGLAMLLSVLYVRYRDVSQIWSLMLQLLFFGSAILYVITRFPEDVQRWMAVNPLAMIFTEMRRALIEPSAPSAAEVVGGPEMLLIPVGITVTVFVLGFWAFKRQSPRVAELL